MLHMADMLTRKTTISFLNGSSRTKPNTTDLTSTSRRKKSMRKSVSFVNGTLVLPKRSLRPRLVRRCV